ncbi:hypothetical protein ACHAPQ_004003 [Fusarium lateritium]
MAPALLKKASQHFIRLSSCDSKNAFTAPLGPEEAGADSLEEQYARKTGGGSKKWNPFLSAFNRRKNTRSGDYVIQFDIANPNFSKEGKQLTAAAKSSSAERIGHSAFFRSNWYNFTHWGRVDRKDIVRIVVLAEKYRNGGETIQ